MLESLFEVAEEFLTEQAGKDANGQKESLSARQPLAAIRRQATTRDHAVQVRVMEQSLVPGVQHGEKTDLSSEVFRIGGDGTESF